MCRSVDNDAGDYLMPPYRNPVESRASKAPARQFVSDTHDHKPDAKSFGTPVIDFYVGTTFSLREIETALVALRSHVHTLGECHEKRVPAAMKTAADEAGRVASQISALAAHLARVTTEHINRRPRA